MADLDGFTQNILGVSDLIQSEVNKIASPIPEQEGVSGEEMDVLDLPMEDDELLELRDDWESKYATYDSNIQETGKRNLRSYLGRTQDGLVPDMDHVVAANLQFTAEETFLPAATAQDPDPFVYSDNTPEGNSLSKDVETMLSFHADQLLLRRKMAVMARQWSIYHLGVLKPGWDSKINDVAVDNRKIQDFVFDPDGFVDAYGDFSSWLGERITITAQKLIDLFPKHKVYITLQVDGKLGTPVTYTEWWTDEFCFSTFKDIVLDKHKNEYFNYESEDGSEVRNHFAQPKKPYVFLSVFSLQERPHDITGLIEQNIPNQNKITRRTEQIDVNVSKCNNSELYSENNFDQQSAKQAAQAIADPNKGQVLVPQGGPIGEAIVRLPAPSFPESAFKDLENSENHLKDSWGTQGIASQQQRPDETAKGMVLSQQRDTSRIGGGIVDVLEQSVARNIFNWLVQLYYVFYDEKHFGAILGSGKAIEYVTLSKSNLDRQLIVGVSPNSMRPKDEITKINQATNLYQMGAIGPKTLLETLDFPNPDDAAADGVLWKLDPNSYLELNFPDLMSRLQQLQAQKMQAMATPGIQPQPQPTPETQPPPVPDNASAMLANREFQKV